MVSVRSFVGSLVVGGALLAWAPSASADAIVGLGAGTFLGDVGSDMTADGSAVVGLRNVGGVIESFRWTAGGGAQSLGAVPTGWKGVYATAISDDGTKVFGYVHGDDTVNVANDSQAFVWQLGGSLTLLEVPGATGAVQTGAYAGTADGNSAFGFVTTGSQIVGARWTTTDGSWSAGSIVYTDLGVHSGDARTVIGAVSDDGSIAYGHSQPSHGSVEGTQAVRWDAATGTYTPLGDLPVSGSDPSTYSAVANTTSDGQVAVGFGTIGDWTQPQAALWTDANGAVPILTGLGYLNEQLAYSTASDITDDGQTVVGYSRVYDAAQNAVNAAFIWDSVNGMRRLEDVLVDEYGLDLGGWTLSRAQSISADGRTIAGDGYNAQGQYEAWILTLPAVAGPEVPEPGTWALLSVGALAVSGRLRRRRPRSR